MCALPDTQEKRSDLLGMDVNERKGFVGVSVLHLRNARTALSQLYERNGADFPCSPVRQRVAPIV